MYQGTSGGSVRARKEEMEREKESRECPNQIKENVTESKKRLVSLDAIPSSGRNQVRKTAQKGETKKEASGFRIGERHST